MGKTHFVNSLEEKQSIQDVFLVRDKSSHTGKTGKSYLSLSLSDKTGTIDARIWDNADDWNEKFDADDFIQVKGFVQKFQNRNQLVIQSLEVVDTFDVKMTDFLPTSKEDPKKMFNELMELVDKVQDRYIKEMLVNTLNDAEIKPLVLSCPAAKTIHHPYLGGLLEHILSISNVMVSLANHYKSLNFDLLLFGAIYHDIGKIWELSYEKSFGYTDVGRLVGHIPLGSELVEKKASEIDGFPYDLKNVLKHLVLSHHGKLEFGSPKRPKFLEALVVAYIDDLDSKINALEQFIGDEKKLGNKRTRYNNMYDRYFFTDTLKEGWDETTD